MVGVFISKTTQERHTFIFAFLARRLIFSDINRFGRIYQQDKGMMPMKVVEIFKDQLHKSGVGYGE